MRKIYLPLLLMLSGCCPPVKEKVPECHFHTQWKHKQTPTVEQQAPAAWWEIFEDGQLNSLVVLALQNSPTLTSALSRVEEAIYLADSAWADQFPTMAANGDGARRRIAKDRRTVCPTATGKFYQQDPTTATTQDPLSLTTLPPPVVMLPEMKEVRSPKFYSDLLATLVVRYELDIWGKRYLSQKAAYKRAEASAADFQSARLILIDQVASTYFSFQSESQELQILEEELKILQESLLLFDSEYRAGLTDKSALLTREALLNSKQIEKEALVKSQQTHLHLLAVLIGVEPCQLSLETIAPNWAFPIVPAGLPSSLLIQRPDIRQSYKELEAMLAEIGIAKTELLPSISLIAGGGYNADKDSRLFKWKNRIWDLSASFKWLLFDMGSRRAQVRATQARFNSLAANFIDQVLTSVKEVEDALVAVKTQQQRQRSAENKEKAFTSISQINTAQFNSGLVDYRQTLSAREEQLRAERESLRESTLLQLSALALIKSLGGTWQGQAD